MKILLVSNYYYPEHLGGVETVSYHLTKHYRKFSHEVRWVAADVPPKLRAASKDDVPISSWNITEQKLGFPSPLPHPNVLKKLFNHIKWCDIVHLQDCLYLINILVFIVAKFLKKPVLITQYAKFIPYAQSYKRILQAAGYRTIGSMMFHFSNKIVFITSNVRDGMKYLAPRKQLDVVPLGVDTDFYRPVSVSERYILRKKTTNDPSIPIILFVGRMVERKGAHLVRSIVEKHKEWNWVFVGRPDDYNPGEWGCSNLQYFQNVSEAELRDFYAMADILVHPSIGEGFTLIASEAMACGTPVVISEESLHEIDMQDRNLFFSTKPTTASIEKALQNVLADIPGLNNLRPKIREYTLARLSWEKMCEQYFEILNDMVVRNIQ